MPQTIGTRTRSTYGRHSKVIQSHDGLHEISSGALLLLRHLGRELVAVETHKLSAFALDVDDGHVRARLEWDVALPIRPAAIADAAHGVLVAWNDQGRTILALAECGRLSLCTSVPGTLTALTSCRTEALLATQDCGFASGRLWRVDIARCAVVAERPLPSANVDLKCDVNGRWVTVTDRCASTVTTIPATLGHTPDPVHPSSETTAGQHDPAPHASSCCCCTCEPAGPRGGGAPGDGGTAPGDPPRGGPPSGGTPTGGPRTGTTGTPTGTGGTVVGHGGRVGQHDPGGDDAIPCALDLLWEIAFLQSTSGFVVAADAARRNLAVIGFNPFRVVDERQLGRGRFQIALDREAPLMVVRDVGRREWSLLNLDVASELTKDIDKLLPLIVPPHSAVFFGLHTESLIGGHAPPNGPIKTLLLPVIEKAQSYTSADISTWAAYLDRTMVPAVVDYYRENSFGQLTDITFQTFGRDVGPAGGPLVLPRDHMADYFWPAWDPAKLILTRTTVPAAALVVFDGRESMQIDIHPDGGLPPKTLDVPFAALAFDSPQDLFPVGVHFDAADRLALKVVTPAGSALTLNLQFTAKTINIAETNVAAGLDELATYLDGILQAAEIAAGISTRLFAKPVGHRIHMNGRDFGRLVVTVNAAATTGPKLSVRSATASVAGSDPLGMNSALIGTNKATSDGDLQTYLNLMLDLAREAAGLDENTRVLDPASVVFNTGANTLTATIPISTVVGGPAASLALKSSAGLADLFTSTSATPNGATTANSAEALRDVDALFADVFTAASHRLLDAKRDPKVELAGWQVAMIIPVDAATNVPGDPDSVQPFERWNVTPLSKPFDFRGVESFRTVSDVNDDSIQLKAVWTLDFFNAGKPDTAMICHELGHGVGFRDLYQQTGYREDLAYLDDWAIMANHRKMPHHSGYHKLQAGWITDDRTIVIPPTDPHQTTNTEALLVPVELWDGGYQADARAAFAAAPDMPVVQLVRLDLGGDGAVFDLIEARQKGAHFSQNLPSAVPGLLVTNAIEPWDDQRYSFNASYRRELQLLNPNNILSNAGDSFDLAKAAGLSAKGIVVTVLDRKVVRDATVFHVRITRTNTDFVDLYFANADPYYRNSDLWVDWAGDNASADPKDHHDYPLGQPTDQGEIIRVPDKGTELHWIVARLRNRGQVHAEQVKLNFKICIPPGGGDRSGNFQLLGTTTIADMPGADVPVSSPFRWDVPAGFGGHTCLAVEIADYKIPKDSDGAALGSDDVWLANNHAQKNVDEFIPLQHSPFEAIEFDYGVHNDAPRPEIAYLEPDGLPYGMKLTVTPPSQVVPPKTTVIFRCKLELDDTIIAAGCRSDRQFRIVTWRRDPESTTKWGGVQYKVRPRKGCAASLTGSWSYNDEIQLQGAVTPNPGGGIVRIRLAFDGADVFWVPVNVAPDGTFVWNGHPQGTATQLDSVAAFEGTALYGPARSAPLHREQPPQIR